MLYIQDFGPCNRVLVPGCLVEITTALINSRRITTPSRLTVPTGRVPRSWGPKQTAFMSFAHHSMTKGLYIFHFI